MPLSPNGKVDRSALPVGSHGKTPKSSSRSRSQSYEAIITSVWERVLNCGIGPYDNFFDLGGDSLLLIEVHSELQKQLSREVNLMDLFEVTTVRALAGRLADMSGSGNESQRLPDRVEEHGRDLARQPHSPATT